MTLWIASLLAVLVAAGPDFPGARPAGALALLGGGSLLLLPMLLLAALARVIPPRAAPPAATRILCAAALAGPAAALAALRLAPTFPAPMPWALPAVLVVGLVLFAAVVWLGRKIARPAAPLRSASACVCAMALAALFLSVHLGEATFAAVRPGTGLLHLALYVGTWIASAALLAPWAAALALEELASSPRARLLLGCLGAAAGVALLAADRMLLVDLYPAVHRWLGWTGLISVAAGAALILGARTSAIWRRASGVALAILVTAAAAFAVQIRDPSPGVRADLAGAALGKTLIGMLRPARRNMAPLPEHPLLRFDHHLDAPGPPGDLNILLVTVDALRADQVDADLPRLRAFAAESIRFRRAYTQGTRTALAVGALMMGRYCANIDWRLLIYRKGTLLDPKTLTPAELAESGGHFVYTTVPENTRHGMLAERLRRAGLWTMATPYAGNNEFFHKDGEFDHGFDRFADLTEVQWTVPTSDNVATVAIRQLEEAAGKRFFQWVHFYDPHRAGGDAASYKEMVLAFDRAFGTLLIALKRMGLMDRTIIVLSADHGEALGEHNHKGHATSLYEEQALVPLLVRVPGLPARSAPHPVALIDVTATLAAAAGADTTELDGVNLWPLIRENRYPAARPIFLELHRYYSNQGVLTSDLKGVVLGDWKLIQDRVRGTEQLFHLTEDPGETDNRVERDAARADELKAVLESFISRAEAAHPLP